MEDPLSPQHKEFEVVEKGTMASYCMMVNVNQTNCNPRFTFIARGRINLVKCEGKVYIRVEMIR
jgi:hypothetical protein